MFSVGSVDDFEVGTQKPRPRASALLKHADLVVGNRLVGQERGGQDGGIRLADTASLAQRSVLHPCERLAWISQYRLLRGQAGNSVPSLGP